MGIERFFNSLKNTFNITKSYTPNSNDKIKCNYLFLDFNSIIHTVSQRVNNIIDKLIIEALKDFNGCSIGNLNNYWDLINEPSPDIKDAKSETDLINKYKHFFSYEKFDEIIINNIKIFLLNLFKKFNKKTIAFIYISIDGVPTKAKMTEQKKRRFMGEFEVNIKNEIVKKHKKKLDINKSANCKVNFNKYTYLTNHIHWSRGAISPATSFMTKLYNELNDINFKYEINQILPLVNSKDIYVSNFTENHEAEKKIMDFIDNVNNEIKGDVCIISPDGDLILLTMILKNKNLKKIIFRIDQQKKTNNTYDIFYDIIYINSLEDEIHNYIDKNLNKNNIINDLVFIFTFFGNDFIPKLDSFDPRTDIKLIIDIYKKFINNKNYILDNVNGLYKINYNNFLNLLKLFVEKENELIQENVLAKKFKNYRYLVQDINSKLINIQKQNKNIEYFNKFNKIDSSNILDFIQKYNINKDVKLLNKNIIKIINSFIDNYVPNASNDNLTYENINTKISIDKFIIFLDKNYHNFYKEFINNVPTINKLSTKIINIKTLKDNLFKLNDNAKFIKPKSFINLNFKETIRLIILHYYIYKSIPIEIYDIPDIKMKYLKLYKYPSSINDNYYKKITESFSEYEKEIFKFDKMLDEFGFKLNKIYNNPLGNLKYDFEKRKQLFYNNFFKDTDLALVMRMYIDGLQWLLDYYYNDITYHNWYYIYDKSPLLQDIYNYFLEINDNKIFNNSKQALTQCCHYKSVTDNLTPLEHLLFITPFDKNGTQLKFFYSYSHQKELETILSTILNDSNLKNLYPDINQISKNILFNKKNNDIDCRSAIFLNKCILNSVHSSNLIDINNFKLKIREILSTEIQNSFYKILHNDIKTIKKKLKKNKMLFYSTGELKYKKKYVQLKKFIIS